MLETYPRTFNLEAGLLARTIEGHGEHMTHCRVCADSCRRCEEACRELLSAMAVGRGWRDEAGGGADTVLEPSVARS